MTSHLFGFVKLTDTQFYVLSIDTPSPYALRFFKITFSLTSTDWAMKMSCYTGNCGIGLSELVLSADNSKLHAFIAYGPSSRSLYYCALSASTGSVISSRYKSNSPIYYVYGAAVSGDYVVAVLYIMNDLMILNTATSVWSSKTFGASGDALAQ